MADACNPENLSATVTSHNQAKGRDIFTEAERYNQMNGGQRGNYEKLMADTFGLSHRKTNSNSAWDTLPKYKGETLADKAVYSPPSDVLEGKFWDSVDARLTKWSKGKSPDMESFKKEVAPVARNTIKAIDNIVQNQKGEALKRDLAKLGLRPDTVYEAKNYLQWLSDGGHLQGSGNAKWLTDKASQLAKAQASMNVTWTVGNGVDAIRIASNYINTPKALIEGTAKTLSSNPFAKNKRFNDMGIYGTQRAEVNPNAGRFDPFNRSIIAQKNWVANIQESLGQSVEKGIKNQLFDSKPWDKPRGERFQGGDLVFGLGRYAINESRWLYKTTRQALGGDTVQASRLATYLVSRVALTGIKAQIPSFVYSALPKDWKANIAAAEKKYGVNLIKVVSGKAFQNFGVDASVDVSDYVSPFGGSLGQRASMLKSSAEGIVRSGSKTAVNTAQGKFAPAAANALATAFAMANYGVLAKSAEKIGKGVSVAQKLEGSTLNSTTLTKMLSTIGDGLEKEFSSDKWATEGAKAALGRNNIKKASE